MESKNRAVSNGTKEQHRDSPNNEVGKGSDKINGKRIDLVFFPSPSINNISRNNATSSVVDPNTPDKSIRNSKKKYLRKEKKDSERSEFSFRRMNGKTPSKQSSESSSELGGFTNANVTINKENKGKNGRMKKKDEVKDDIKDKKLENEKLSYSWSEDSYISNIPRREGFGIAELGFSQTSKRTYFGEKVNLTTDGQQRFNYYFSSSPNRVDNEPRQYSKKNFPLTKNCMILVSNKYNLFISSLLGKFKAYYIRVKSQKNQKYVASVIIAKNSTDDVLREACLECFQTYDQLAEANGKYNLSMQSKISEPFLKNIGIVPLEKVVETFPDAIYYCTKCEYHLSSIAHIKSHIEDNAHYTILEKEWQRKKLINMTPFKTKRQLNSIEDTLRRELRIMAIDREKNEGLIESVKKYILERLEPLQFKNLKLSLFGSYQYNVQLEDSDVNLALMIDGFSVKDYYATVMSIKKCFNEDEVKCEVDGLNLPYLSITFKNVIVRCYLYANNPCMQYVLFGNLMKTYCDLRKEVSEFLTLVRMWAQKTELDSKNRQKLGLSRCGFDLMAIHYLQQIEMIPVLHELTERPKDDPLLIPETAKERRIRLMSKYESNLDVIKSKFDINKEWNMAALWMDFFEYYLVNRLEKRFQITEKVDSNKLKSKKKLVVIDPFSGDNVLRLPTISTWLPYYLNCILVTYEYYNMPRTKNSSMYKVNFYQENKNKIAKIFEKKEEMNSEETEDENEVYDDTYFDNMISKLSHDGIPFKELTASDIEIDDHFEHMYSKRTLTRIRRKNLVQLNSEWLDGLAELDVLDMSKIERPTASENEGTEIVADKEDTETVSQKEETETVAEKEETETVAENEEIETVKEKEDTETVKEKEDTETVAEKEEIETLKEKEDTETVAEKEETQTVAEKEEIETLKEKEDTETVAEKEETETVAEKEETETVAEKEETETVAEKEETETVAEKEETETVAEKEETETVAEKEETETVAEKEETETVAEKEDTETVAEKEETETVAELKTEHKLPERRCAYGEIPSSSNGPNFLMNLPHVFTKPDLHVCHEDFFLECEVAMNMRKFMKILEKESYRYEFNRNAFTRGWKMEIKCTNCDGAHYSDTCPLLKVPGLEVANDQKSPEEIAELNEIIMHNYNSNIISEERIEDIKKSLENLEQYLSLCFDRTVVLEMFGSIMSGMGVINSDVDICFRFSDSNEAPKDIDPVAIIEKISKKIADCDAVTNIQAITTAKVPIVKFKLYIKKNVSVDADLSFYNTLAIYNTKLLKSYCAWTPNNTFAKLGLFVKKWAKKCKIGDASKGSLSSYAHILMLIHYLQQCEPPVLPRLQEDYVDNNTEKRMVENWDTYFFEASDEVIEKWQKNSLSPAELLIGFFDYFARFDFRRLVVQCRRNAQILKMEKDWIKPFCLEDPFELNHNLGSGISNKMFTFIHRTFIASRNEFVTLKVRDTIKRDANFAQNYMTAILKNCSQGNPPVDRLCRRCGKIGHFADNCSRKEKGPFKKGFRNK